MRFIADRWYLVPIAAIVAIYFCCIATVNGANERIAVMVPAGVKRIYTLAQQGRYDQLVQEGLMSENSAKYLREQERCFGRISEWRVVHIDNAFYSHYWTGRVYVKRKLLESADDLAGTGPHDLEVSLANSVIERDVFGQLDTAPVKSAIQLKNYLAQSLQTKQDDGEPKKVTAVQIGDLWLVTEIRRTTDKQLHTRYVVVRPTGEVVEYVRSDLNEYKRDVLNSDSDYAYRSSRYQGY